MHTLGKRSRFQTKKGLDSCERGFVRWMATYLAPASHYSTDKSGDTMSGCTFHSQFTPEHKKVGVANNRCWPWPTESRGDSALSDKTIKKLPSVQAR